MNDALKKKLGETPLVDAETIEEAHRTASQCTVSNQQGIMSYTARTLHTYLLAIGRTHCLLELGAERQEALLPGQYLAADQARANQAARMRRRGLRGRGRPHRLLHPLRGPYAAQASSPRLADPRQVRYSHVCASPWTGIGENYFAKHRSEHSWSYFPSMTPDETILIKQWDSHGDLAPSKPSNAAAGTSTFALHSAFADPHAPPEAPDRESIEVRLVLVF